MTKALENVHRPYIRRTCYLAELRCLVEIFQGGKFGLFRFFLINVRVVQMTSELAFLQLISISGIR